MHAISLVVNRIGNLWNPESVREIPPLDAGRASHPTSAQGCGTWTATLRSRR